MRARQTSWALTESSEAILRLAVWQIAIRECSIDPVVIAHHLILTGYGHWLPNDPRGSLSPEIKAGKLFPLGDVHLGRKMPQPLRENVRRFSRRAAAKLEHRILWFDAARRQAIAEMFSEVINAEGYTCFACAIMSNHAHLVIRKHRDKAEMMIRKLKNQSAARLRVELQLPLHPIWSGNPFKRFIITPKQLRETISYVRANPMKSGLPVQKFEFVKPYRGEWAAKRQAGERRPANSTRHSISP
ncbi:MAG TPA: transposase [Phycisphaerae bacterium]|nr:transposase [Phycisphaerae bacterium]